MATLHRLLAVSSGAALDPVLALGPLAGLVLVSALGGVAALAAFRWTSRPAAIREARRRVQAHLLAVRIYRDDLGVVFRAQASVLRALGAYVGHMLVPFLVLLPPFALLFAHLDARWSSRAMRPGERAVLKAVVDQGELRLWKLEGSEGVAVDSPPVRIAARREVAWRIQAIREGTHHLSLVGPGGRVDKQVVVASGEAGAAARRSAAGLGSLFLAPAESPIEAGAGVRTIEVGYAPRALTVLGWHTHWIVVFLVVSTAVALTLRRRAGVEL
ncbi:MAG: hypothetical protein HYY35_10410 [Deltaproteobacteria bacterium]|nr:hypothetical protein [Deltaproteobacteria bacterium]